MSVGPLRKKAKSIFLSEAPATQGNGCPAKKCRNRGHAPPHFSAAHLSVSAMAARRFRFPCLTGARSCGIMAVLPHIRKGRERMRNKNIWIGIGLVAAIALVAVLAMVLPTRIASPASDAPALAPDATIGSAATVEPAAEATPRQNLPPSLPRRRSLPSSLRPPRSLQPSLPPPQRLPARMNLTPGRRKRRLLP